MKITKGYYLVGLGLLFAGCTAQTKAEDPSALRQAVMAELDAAESSGSTDHRDPCEAADFYGDGEYCDDFCPAHDSDCDEGLPSAVTEDGDDDSMDGEDSDHEDGDYEDGDHEDGDHEDGDVEDGDHEDGDDDGDSYEDSDDGDDDSEDGDVDESDSDDSSDDGDVEDSEDESSDDSDDATSDDSDSSEDDSDTGDAPVDAPV